MLVKTPPKVPELVPVRMLTQFTYCKRLGFYEWVDGVFAESVDTIDGTFQHRRVDQEAGTQATADALSVRSLMLSAPQLGLIGKIDLLEQDGAQAVPIEYKRGKKPPTGQDPYLPERVQVCAQALILRENGFEVPHGEIYYAQSRARVPIPLSDELVQITFDLLAELKQVASDGEIPEPLDDSPKCARCSLVGICLPDETTLLQESLANQQYIMRYDKQRVRRLITPNPEQVPFYLQEQGSKLGVNGDVLTVKKDGETLGEIRLLSTSSVHVYGNVQVSTQALRKLCAKEVPLFHFSYGGWFYGVTAGLPHKNIELRRQQFTAFQQRDRCVEMAKRVVKAKLKNCRTLLRRNAKEIDPTLRQMSAIIRRVSEAKYLGTILGHEGTGAREYFAAFTRMLKLKDATFSRAFRFDNRNRRPPTDPINAMLSFGYSLLAKDCTQALMACGFDPYFGFYHQPRYGRPALALDLMEEFRPLIVDSVVLTVLNNGVIVPDDFLRAFGAVTMTKKARKSFIEAYERRMETEVTHPVFGYKLSYRRVLEVQARLLARFVSEEIDIYPEFVTR